MDTPLLPLLTETGLEPPTQESPLEVPNLDSTTNLAGLNPTTRLLTALKAVINLPEVDYNHGLTKDFLPTQETWFQPGVLGVAIMGEHPFPVLLMSLATYEAIHYVAVLQHVGCYIGTLQATDVLPSRALNLRRPKLTDLKSAGGFLNPKKSGGTHKVCKIGICPPALADEIMDSHAYPNTIYAALMSTAETIPGKAALLHWLQFAAIGEKTHTAEPLG
jgi:hypothetical protein